ncbi:MAG: hypothetical protein AUK51_04555 [Comamonadaceae bacterium CG2_30_59_20]|nr:MAG: hypothetical protein AUK51_04555 [Comamonadaceae bacterium CG2_30_59_20]
MQAMLKVPDNSISQLQTIFLKNGVKNDIQRNNLSFVYKIANLPANTASWGQNPDTGFNHLCLLFQIVFKT